MSEYLADVHKYDAGADAGAVEKMSNISGLR